MAFLSHLIYGLQLGAIYALVALGYSMVYGIIRLINFAHGDIIMVASFVVWYLINASERARLAEHTHLRRLYLASRRRH